MLSILTTFHRCVAISSFLSLQLSPPHPPPHSPLPLKGPMLINPSIPPPSILPSFLPSLRLPSSCFFRIAKLNRTLGTPPPAKTPPFSQALSLSHCIFLFILFLLLTSWASLLSSVFFSLTLSSSTSSHHCFLSTSQVSLMTFIFVFIISFPVNLYFFFFTLQ